jgi:DNA-binding LacI/PurR family transcriptional regulator
VAQPNRPSIKAVAERAGVSASTVSRVLRKEGYASEAARNGVLEAARELGYEPDLAAQMLKSGSSAIIGVEIQDVTNPFYASVAAGIAEVSRGAAYVPFLSDSQEDPKREHENLRMMLRIRVAGLIITPTINNVALLHRFQELGIPLVQVDRVAPKVISDTVVVENERAAREATEHLIGLGHERIGVLAGPGTLTTGRERLLGYTGAMRDHGLPVDDRLVKVSDYRRDSGVAAARALLDESPPPTAVFTHNNVLAERLLAVLAERRLRVPDDVAVVTFDDPSWARLVTPPLTVIRQPARRMGSIAADLILRRLRDESPDPAPAQVRLGLQMIVRGSCGGRPSGPAEDAAALEDG